MPINPWKKRADIVIELEEAISVGGGGGSVDSVNGHTGVVVLDKADIGLSNVDNTPDDEKPLSDAMIVALNTKVPASTLNESIDDRIAALLVAGSNVTITYDDTANTLTISTTLSSNSYFPTGW